MGKRIKIAIWQILAAILYAIAVVWNIRTGGNYNLELAVGGFILVIIKIIEDLIKK